MISITNPEKQARFRKKEVLKKRSEQYFREWQVMASRSRVQPREASKLFSDAAELPSGWTDEEYGGALQKLEQLRIDLITSQDYVRNDIHEAVNTEGGFMASPDPGKFIAETKSAVNDAHDLAAHLISALELSRCNDAGKAAALMEVMRHVGRNIANSTKIPKSDATAVCLATLTPQYARPDWFVAKMTRWLSFRLEEELSHELGTQLLRFDYKAFDESIDAR